MKLRALVAGLDPWASEGVPTLPVSVDARLKSLSSGTREARTRGPDTNEQGKSITE